MIDRTITLTIFIIIPFQMATLTVTPPTFIDRLCQTPTILWNVWDYCIPSFTKNGQNRRTAAIILLYLFGKPTHRLNGMWEQGIDSYLQSHLPKYYQEQLDHSVLNCLTFYATYVEKFSTHTFRWYKETDDDLPDDWNNSLEKIESSYSAKDFQNCYCYGFYNREPWISSNEKDIYYFDQSNITDKGLTTFAQGCSNIEDIGLNHTKITDKGLTALAKNCPNIKNIDLTMCDLITDQGLIALAKGCPHIQRINLTHCDSFTDKGLIALAQGCPNIQEIFLPFYNMSDQGLIALAQGCPNISVIYVDCKNVTDEGLIALAKGCPKIQHIRVRRNFKQLSYNLFPKSQIL